MGLPSRVHTNAIFASASWTQFSVVLFVGGAVTGVSATFVVVPVASTAIVTSNDAGAVTHVSSAYFKSLLSRVDRTCSHGSALLVPCTRQYTFGPMPPPSPVKAT